MASDREQVLNLELMRSGHDSGSWFRDGAGGEREEGEWVGWFELQTHFSDSGKELGRSNRENSRSG